MSKCCRRARRPAWWWTWRGGRALRFQAFSLLSEEHELSSEGTRTTSVVLAVASLAALTHGDATEVQGQITGETQHAEQVAVEAKAGQSLLFRSSSREVVQST